MQKIKAESNSAKNRFRFAKQKITRFAQTAFCFLRFTTSIFFTLHYLRPF